MMVNSAVLLIAVCFTVTMTVYSYYIPHYPQPISRSNRASRYSYHLSKCKLFAFDVLEQVKYTRPRTVNSLSLLDFNEENRYELEEFENDLDEDRDDEEDEAEEDDVDSVDNVVYDVDTTVINTDGIKDEWRGKIEDVVNGHIRKDVTLSLQSIKWFSNRLEIVVSSNIDQPSAGVLTTLHQDIYNDLDVREDELRFISRYEVLLATPGIGENLSSDREFVTFKGFPVTVTTSEIYKKKTSFEGNLIGRDDDKVYLSLKGRIVHIPRGLVQSVKLPKAKIEPTDIEMRKLANN